MPKHAPVTLFALLTLLPLAGCGLTQVVPAGATQMAGGLVFDTEQNCVQSCTQNCYAIYLKQSPSLRQWGCRNTMPPSANLALLCSLHPEVRDGNLVLEEVCSRDGWIMH